MFRTYAPHPETARGLPLLCLGNGANPAARGAGSEGLSQTSDRRRPGFSIAGFRSAGPRYRYQVYVPEEWRRDDHKQWPVILFLHGRGERGSEGMWQTQIGLPQAIRDHPERWPFIVVMPQCSHRPLLDRPGHARDGHGRAGRGDRRVSRRSGSHVSYRDCRWAGTARGNWRGNTPRGGRRLQLRPAASSGAMRRSAGSRPPLCPASMRRRWDTRRCGCFMALKTMWWRRGRMS